MIRQMQVADAEAVSQLSVELGYTIDTQQTAENILRILSGGDHVLYVWEQEHTVTGWIHGFIACRIESLPFAEIGGLVVAESERGKGTGRSLVNAVIEWAGEKGIDNLRVRCNTKRKDAHEFYRALGFEENKEQKIFRKDLNEKPRM